MEGPSMIDTQRPPLASDAQNSGGAVLEADGIVVRYDGVTAVGGVSLRLAPGEIVGLIGPNGAGKSTTLGALGGQIKLSGGSIRLRGQEIGRLPPHRRARLGLSRTFQSTSEFEGMTVFENLVTAGRGADGASLRSMALHRKDSRRSEGEAASHAWDVLARFEVEHAADLYGRELSGGQRRLVEIMRCLMRHPAVLLLDEPMVGVAPHLVDKLVADLSSIRADGISLVIVEHALEVVRKLCDRVVVMAQGQVIASGSYADVVEDAAVRKAYLG
jgi:branched-chain amino acid transport system ATP-binding protein